MLFERKDIISKLPVRQVTHDHNADSIGSISKLPVRQVTMTITSQWRRRISKLPVRQVTVLDG